MIIWRDGALVEGGSALSADDRGWLIGDAAFETVLVRKGAPAFLEAHLDRLRGGLGVLGIAAPLDQMSIREAIAAAAAKNSLDAMAACRITISRVGGPRGLAPSAAARAQTVISLAPLQPPKGEGRVIVSMRRRFSGATTNAFKCAGAYAENMIARIEAAAVGADEAIMLNERGRVASATSANVFAIAGGRIATPPVSEGAMPGVVRAILIEEAKRLGLDLAETPVEPQALAGATIALTNSIVGVKRCALEEGRHANDDAVFERLAAAYDRRLAAAWSAAEERRGA